MTRAWSVSLAVSLGLTLAVELAFALLCRKRGRALLLTALANILTNPVVVLAALLWRYFVLPGYGLAVAALEIAAVAAEGLVYHKKCRESFPRPYLFSLAANALSFSLGALLRLIL